MLTKTKIPIQLSSQPEECLQEIHKRKEKLTNALKEYKESKLAEKMSEPKTSKHDLGKITPKEVLSHMASLLNTPKSIKTPQEEYQVNSDTKSEISSCLDSNYESDSNFNGASSISLSEEKEDESEKLVHSLLPKLSVRDLERQITITNDSLILNNSDDSDVTINEAMPSSKNKSETNTLAESEASSELESACKTPTAEALLATLQYDNTQKSTAQECDITPKTFMRMNSDGYSSSYTPLSASSINSENPAKNPFFQTMPHNENV